MTPKKRKIMISAGEHSGDLHGAALVSKAHEIAPELSFFGLGGDLMAAAGVQLEAHLRETSVMGITEVLGSLPRLLKLRRHLANLVKSSGAEALVVIDSPDFNFRLARAAYEAGVPVIYYICPQVWAWRQSRLKFLGKFIKRRAVILPFEKDFYLKHGLTADSVGHPLLDELPPPRPRQEIRAALGLPESPVLAILPGSRTSTVRRLAPIMFKTAELLLERCPELNLAIPQSIALPDAFMEQLLAKAPERVRQNIHLFQGRSHEVLGAATAALLASGTSTVEGTILGVPMVVTYKTSALSWFLARCLVSVPFVSIANLVAGREVIPELLQDKSKPELLAQALWPLLNDDESRAAVIDNLNTVTTALGGSGASAAVVNIILEEIQRST